LSGSVLAIVLSLPAFWLMQTNNFGTIAVGVLLLAITLVHFSGTAPSTLPAFFPTSVRYGALAISFNVSVALFGGTTPLLAEWLNQRTGSLYSPAWLLMIAGLTWDHLECHMQKSAVSPLLGAPPSPERSNPRKST